MYEITLILAVLTILANLLIWHAKRKTKRTKADESSKMKRDLSGYSKGFLNTPEIRRLKQSAAAELDISVEDLDRMSVKEINQLAGRKELI